jgi:hypothetical protein
MDLQEIRCNGVEWIYLAQDGDKNGVISPLECLMMA